MSEMHIEESPPPLPAPWAGRRTGLSLAVRSLKEGQALIIPLNGRSVSNVQHRSSGTVSRVGKVLGRRFAVRGFADCIRVYRLPDDTGPAPKEGA